MRGSHSPAILSIHKPTSLLTLLRHRFAAYLFFMAPLTGSERIVIIGGGVCHHITDSRRARLNFGNVP
jgi:hypothetical protein